MAIPILEVMARDGFEEVIALRDRRSGLRAWLALHDTSSGPAFGGIRRFSYAREEAALIDCLRLALAMSWKVALAGIDGGGGKLVILDTPDLELESAYRYVGSAVERMGGRFYAGPDVGTDATELSWVAGETGFVAEPGEGKAGDLAGATMLGAYAGVCTVLNQLDGELDWSRRTVVIQGLGQVGYRLAERLKAAGARVVASDLDEERAAAARDALDLEITEAGSEFDVPCDVFAPCAMGGVLHDLTIKRLACRSVVGAANNILARSHHGETLHRRGILYLPEFVVNCGAVIRGAAYHLQGLPAPDEEIERHVSGLAAEILRRACAEDRPPSAVAVEEAERRLSLRRREAVEA